MADMELGGALDSTAEENTESNPQQDLETLIEADAIKNDPTRMDAVKALAKEQGIDVPGLPSQKSFKDTLKGIGSTLGEGMKP